MAENLRILGQLAPATNTETNLVVVPASTSAVISTITVCNRDAAPGTFRIIVAEDGAATANQQYLYYDANIGPSVTVAITIGVTLSAADVIRVRASNPNMSFQAFGTEVTP